MATPRKSGAADPQERDRGMHGRFVKSVETAERDAKACALRRDGHTYQAIADTLNYANAQAAKDGVQRALDATARDAAEDVRKLEMDRLDQMLAKVSEIVDRRHLLVQSGKVVIDETTGLQILDDGPALAAVDRLLRIQERRARLLGLDAPTKVQTDQKVRYEVVGVNLEELS